MPPKVQHRNRQVIVDQTQLVANNLEETYLTADIAAASSTLTVANINNFSTSQILIINPFSETAEVIKTHASSAPSGTTITLAANTVFAHSTGQKVYRIEFDQIEISQASTLTGSKTVLTTSNIQADQENLIYLDTTITSGYYFARFKETVGSTFGSYSDGIIYGGWATNTVGYMIDRALADLSLSLSSLVKISDCLAWLTEGMNLIEGKLLRWPEHISYNTVIGQTSRGTNIIAMPTDTYDTETNRSIIGVRVGDGKNLTYLDPVSFDAQMEGVRVTQVTTQATSGQTTLEIDNSYDFADSGSVNVYISGTKYSITYTGVTRSSTAGILTGVPASGTGSITVTIPVDTYVWQNETEGIPTWFTVRNGNLEFWNLADSSEDNANVYMDYAKVATTVNSEGDTIDFQRFDILQCYLTWRMKMKAKNNGELDLKDGYYAKFREKLSDAIRTLPPNNLYKTGPKVNHMMKRGLSKPSLQDLSISEQ